MGMLEGLLGPGLLSGSSDQGLGCCFEVDCWRHLLEGFCELE